MFNEEILAMTKKRCAAAAATCPKDTSAFKTMIVLGAAAVITAALGLSALAKMAGL